MQAVAFLRGINVGGHDVRNAQLEELFRALDLDAPSGFLASGNVLFTAERSDTEALEREVATHLEGALGFEVPTFIRTAEQVNMIAGADPFPEAPPDGKVHVAFLRRPPDEDLRRELETVATDTDRIAFAGSDLYWHVAGRFMDSALSGRDVTRLLGADWTVRTHRTVQRIAAKLDGSS